VYHIRQLRAAAAESGFELCGATPALATPEEGIYKGWVAEGYAGEMRYLTDHRAEVRANPRRLLASARTIVCVGKVYNSAGPEGVPISRYAWGRDYHDVMRAGLIRLVERMRQEAGEFDSRICVDTAPLLERSYARLAGLGWIGRNTCLINQQVGSWVFLGEVLTSLEIETNDRPAPDRCGTCCRCIDACPTAAIVPVGDRWTIDSRQCISYLTIEKRGAMPEETREGVGEHVFGCDICQDVCPWNRRAAVTEEPAFAPLDDLSLEDMARLSEEEFRTRFRGTPVSRAKYSGFLRNVAVAIGNSGRSELLPAVRKLAESTDSVVAEHARWAMEKLERRTPHHPLSERYTMPTS